ncbi:hypothetical protein [Streptomyces sp. NPDC092307]|uniref:hypothetical protein n=1 Tax=Streptomyces sp. NPDC092307 TaxID=3366013 RepID=UPI003827DC08
MDSTEGRGVTFNGRANSTHIYTDLLHVHRIMTLRMDRMDEDLKSSLDVAMELIQTVRLSLDEPVTGVGECFAQVFLALHSKMTALDTVRQSVDSLAKLIEYREA